MLNKASALKNYKLDSVDGDIGTIKEFYFDDRFWTIRYLVVDTGNWLTGRQVLISPQPLLGLNHNERKIGVSLTKKQIEDSPTLDSDRPVSRQFEEAYYGYYGWSLYWGGPYMWGPSPYFGRHNASADRDVITQSAQSGKSWDPHLRSTNDVSGRHIHAIDGEIGHVEDFIIDSETWAIRYLVVDTRNWWQGKKVLISPQWIERVSWSESKVFINLSRGAIKQSPEFTQETLITRDYEANLHRHYDREGYWEDESAVKEHSY